MFEVINIGLRNSSCWRTSWDKFPMEFSGIQSKKSRRQKDVQRQVSNTTIADTNDIPKHSCNTICNGINCTAQFRRSHSHIRNHVPSIHLCASLGFCILLHHVCNLSDKHVKD